MLFRSGNLSARSEVKDPNGGLLIETFGYDALNRLTASQVLGLAQKTYGYDQIGNLTNKDGSILSYQNGGARPHAPISVGGVILGVTNPTATYDANGNIQSLSAGATTARSLTWTSFNLPASITRGTTTTSFVYGPEQQRAKQTIKIGRAHV